MHLPKLDIYESIKGPYVIMAQSNTVNGHFEASSSTVRASVLHGIKDLRIVSDFVRIHLDPSIHMILI